MPITKSLEAFSLESEDKEAAKDDAPDTDATPAGDDTSPETVDPTDTAAVNDENLTPLVDEQPQADDVTEDQVKTQETADNLAGSPMALNEFEKANPQVAEGNEDDEFLPTGDTDLEGTEPVSLTPGLDAGIDQSNKQGSGDPEDLADVVAYQDQQKVDAQEETNDAEGDGLGDMGDDSGDAPPEGEDGAEDAPAAEGDAPADAEGEEPKDEELDFTPPEEGAEEPAQESLAYMLWNLSRESMEVTPVSVLTDLHSVAALESAIDEVKAIQAIGHGLTRQGKVNAKGACARMAGFNRVAKRLGIALPAAMSLEAHSTIDNRAVADYQGQHMVSYAQEGFAQIIKAIIDRLLEIWERLKAWVESFWQDATLDVRPAIDQARQNLLQAGKTLAQGGDALSDRVAKIASKPWGKGEALTMIGGPDKVYCKTLMDDMAKSRMVLKNAQASFENAGKKLEASLTSKSVVSLSIKDFPTFKNEEKAKEGADKDEAKSWSTEQMSGGVRLVIKVPPAAFKLEELERGAESKKLLRAADMSVKTKRDKNDSPVQVFYTSNPTDLQQVLNAAVNINSENLALADQQKQDLKQILNKAKSAIKALNASSAEQVDAGAIASCTYALGALKSVVSTGFVEVARVRRRFVVALVKYTGDNTAQMLAVTANANDEVLAKQGEQDI